MATYDFNVANGAVGAPFTEDSAISAGCSIVSNAAYGDGAVNTPGVYYNTASASADSQVTVVGVVNNQGPIINWNGSGSGYMYVAGGVLFRLDSGSPTYLDTTASAAADTDECRIYRDGNDVVCTLNGSEVMRATDTTYTSGYDGWFAAMAAFGGVDDWVSASTGPPPVVTDVDTDETITSTQTNVVITGTDFDTAVVTIGQGAVSVTQSIDSQSGTSIQFDFVLGGLKHGPATLRVTNGDAQYDEIAITINAPSGQAYVDVVTPALDPASRIASIADIAAGDQIQIRGFGGGSIPTGLVVDPDAVPYFTPGNAEDEFEARVWSVADTTWGAWVTQFVSTLLKGKGTTHGLNAWMRR